MNRNFGIMGKTNEVESKPGLIRPQIPLRKTRIFGCHILDIFNQIV